MNQTGITQQYLLCILKENGKLPAFGMEKTIALSAAGVLELLLADVLSYDGKKLTVRTPLPDDKTYLAPVYQAVEKKQPVKFEKIVEYFSVTFTDKNIQELISSVGESLVREGCAQKEKGGLFGGKDLYVPNTLAVDATVQNIRAELLESGELSEDVIALTALLNKSGDLQKYFSAEEKKDLKKRLKEIKDNPQTAMIRKVTEYIESLYLMLIVAVT